MSLFSRLFRRNSQFTNHTAYLQSFGFPIEHWSRNSADVRWHDRRTLSDLTVGKLYESARRVQTYQERLFPWGESSIYLLALVTLSGCVASVLLRAMYNGAPQSGFWDVALPMAIAAPVPLFVSRQFVFYRMKRGLPQLKARIGAEIELILADNAADLELTAELQASVSAFVAGLTSEALACLPTTEIAPVHTDGPWRPHAIQVHAEGVAARDATLCVTADEEGKTARLLVLPSRETVTSWLNDIINSMKQTVREKTHAHEYLDSLQAESLLTRVWQFPSNSLDRIAQLWVTTGRGFADRPSLQIFGYLCDDGQVLLAGLVTDGEPTMFAPTQTVRVLTDSVRGLLAAQGKHPALLSPPEQVAA